jgi:hypothetical protein
VSGDSAAPAPRMPPFPRPPVSGLRRDDLAFAARLGVVDRDAIAKLDAALVPHGLRVDAAALSDGLDAADTAEARFRRALDQEDAAERRYRLARVATDRARDEVLSSRARAIARPEAELLEQVRERLVPDPNPLEIVHRDLKPGNES